MNRIGFAPGWVARRAFFAALRATLLAAFAGAAPAAPVPIDPAPTLLDQGTAWTADAREDFYTRDQGSRLIPLRWIVSLRTSDGTPFMANALARYGYLPNPKSTPAGLPLGFTVAATASAGQVLGMTCAACHTRQIVVAQHAYRVDGGPALADFEHFLTDLDAAVGFVLADDAAFATFSGEVLGSGASAASVATLRADVAAWYTPFHAIISGALPRSGLWGPGRLDALTMIFDRLTGLDLGAPPDYLIAANIKPADAPVRYPFLWDAPTQDHTQWPGFAQNGNDILGLGRNHGEVIGVFATFHPKKDPGRIIGYDFTGENSANFQGLEALEKLIRKIGAPKWPWPIDANLAAQGAQLFSQHCASCHAIRIGELRGLTPTWATQVINVGTDTREWTNLARPVDPGVLAGARIFSIEGPLANPSPPRDVLELAVIGSVLEHYLPLAAPSDLARQADVLGAAIVPEANGLKGFFKTRSDEPAANSYEARVLTGIWASAPYLHNGSVPTLADLLLPPAQRPTAFKVGASYDLQKVGLAAVQDGVTQLLQTTDCSALDSGNSRCGHQYPATPLSEADRHALLEYLKTL
jgi:mono/diheme cytochrome c family protein